MRKLPQEPSWDDHRTPGMIQWLSTFWRRVVADIGVFPALLCAVVFTILVLVTALNLLTTLFPQLTQ